MTNEERMQIKGALLKCAENRFRISTTGEETGSGIWWRNRNA